MHLKRTVDKQTIFVTGTAGFIGGNLSLRLLKVGTQVVGFDNLNDYYDPCIKEYHLGVSLRMR